MSVKAKLIIDEKEINLLWFSFGFSQRADTNGRTSQNPVFIGLDLMIETRKDVNFAEWSFALNEVKQIELHIYPVILGGKTRKLNFYDCHLLKWANNFSATGTQPLSETLKISCAGVTDSNSAGEYSAYWRETFPNTDVETTTIDDEEPKFIEYHFEDMEGEIIAQSQLSTNTKIDLVITTENAIGKVMSINLNDSKLDFIYNDEVLENDILSGVNIDADETRVTLTAIKQ